MIALSAAQLLDIWEWGQDKHPVDRALGLLALACPELAPGQLPRLTIGQRNSRLLSLRQSTLGSTLKGFARCPQCSLPLEFAVEVEALRGAEPEAQEYSLLVDNLALRFRLLNSLDLAAIVGMFDVEAARLRLIESCILEAKQDGAVVAAAELPETALVALINAMNERDPQVEMHFQLTCAACGHRWSALFDIVSFFWTELGGRVRRLLAEVHVLARAYGWREADILALSQARRRSYLELVG